MNKIKSVAELKKFFGENKEESKSIPEADRKMYLEPANVMGIIPKTTRFKDLLVSHFDVEERKIPELSYAYNKGDKPSTSKYSTEYLKKILTFLTVACNDEDGFFISVKYDYPLTIETEEFKIILAPRVETD